MRLLIATILILMPLAIAPRLSFYFDVTPKAAILLIGVALLLLVGAFRPEAFLEFSNSRSGRLFSMGLFASIVLLLTSTALSSEPLAAWNGSNWRRFGALEQVAAIFGALLISAMCAQSPRLRTTVLRATSIAGAIAGAYGIFQYFGFDPLLPPAGYRVGEGVFQIVRPPGTLGHSDYFGAWLLWPFFTGLALRAIEQRGVWRILGPIATSAAGVAIVLSGSRGAMLGLAAGLAVYAAVVRPRARTVAIGLLFAALSFSAFFVSPAGQALRARAHWISEDRAGGARLLLWRDSLRMSLDHPWTGFGPDRFAADFPRYQSTELARAFPDFYHESPHNAVLDTLTASGALAALALLFVVGTGVWAALDPSPSDSKWSGPLLSALLAVFVAQQFIVFTVPTAFCFYLGAGLLAGLHRQPSAATSPLPRYRLLYAAFSIAIATVFAVCGVRLVVADRALAVARNSFDAGDVPATVRALQTAESLRGTGVSADLYFSRRWALAALAAREPLARAQFSQFARIAALRSTERQDQRPNAWYNLALLAAGNNDLPVVESSLRSAIVCAPKWFKPHWSLARVLFASGRFEEARREARCALSLDAAKDPEVVSTVDAILRSQSNAK